MFFKRKIDDSLLKWKKETNGIKALLIKMQDVLGNQLQLKNLLKHNIRVIF